MQLLNKKNIVIIGGSTGMGLSAAKAIVAQGANVVVVGRNGSNVREVEHTLGKPCKGYTGDACDADTAVNAIELCIDAFGGFDGLYHVAGGSGRKMGDGPLHEITLEGWNRTMELNLVSLMLSNQAAVKKFLLLNQPGSILNIGSVLGFSPAPQYFATHAYAAAKAAAIGFIKSIASYYAKNNIRVNLIAPALVETPMSQRAVGNEEIVAFIKAKQPLDGGRVGEAEDLDGLVVYFLSDQSKFTTGQVIAVDGGWSIS
ncbi:MAG: SDR family oxidoreductase [Niabella sp.]